MPEKLKISQMIWYKKFQKMYPQENFTFPRYEDFVDTIFETDIIIKEQQGEVVLFHRCDLS